MVYIAADLGNNPPNSTGLVQGNPSTLKMHMTGMESFNMGNKRGGQNMPMSSTQDSTQHTITTNKSSMCKFCNNLNFV